MAKIPYTKAQVLESYMIQAYVQFARDVAGLADDAFEDVSRADLKGPILDRREAAKYLSVGKTTFHDLVKSGQIKVHSRVGRNPRYAKADLDRYLKQKDARHGGH